MKRGINDLQKEITYYFNYSEEPQETVYHGAEARVLLAGQDSPHGGNSAAPNEIPTALVKEGDRLSLSRWDFLILEEV